MELRDEIARKKAKEMRYKKPMLRQMNLEAIREWGWDAQSAICDAAYAIEDDDILMDALGGATEEAFEFRAAFTALDGDVEKFMEDLGAQWVPECFDLFFVRCGKGGEDMLGYDSYEQDYFGIESWMHGYAAEEAEKHLMRMTKKDLLDAAQQCFVVGFSYLALRRRYEDLQAALEVLRGENKGLHDALVGIEKLYDKAMREQEENAAQGWQLSDRDQREFDRLCEQLPAECWIR